MNGDQLGETIVTFRGDEGDLNKKKVAVFDSVENAACVKRALLKPNCVVCIPEAARGKVSTWRW